MSAPVNPFTLASWRRQVAELYAEVRTLAASDLQAAATRFRSGRDALFRSHPDSPIAPNRRRTWRGCAWFPYDAAWRVNAKVEPIVPSTEFEIDLGFDGTLRCARVGRLRFVVNGAVGTLIAYWLEGYGGGLWLPFADATSGRESYGGGRYLYDTIKGADLGANDGELVLDFNFAYNPSCAYDERWACPLSPSENKLPFAVPVGERMP